MRKHGERVSLYHPDPKRNGVIKGTIRGGGMTDHGFCYIVELESEWQGYLHKDTAGEQYISHVVVNASSVL